MFEYQSVPRVDERRDVLNEIDAGELDEQYLIKHASDYGKGATPNLLGRFKTVVVRLFNAVRFARPQTIDGPAQTVSAPAAQFKLE